METTTIVVPMLNAGSRFWLKYRTNFGKLDFAFILGKKYTMYVYFIQIDFIFSNIRKEKRQLNENNLL